MPKYTVTFIQSTCIEVEAANEEKAFQKALPEFNSAMRRPIARTDYDDFEVEPIDEDEN